MAMSPKEVVRAAIRFEMPDRLPVQIGALGYADTRGISLAHDSERLRTGVGVDEWGCLWEKSEVANMGQVKGHPIRHISQVEDYPFPDPYDPFVYERVRAGLDNAEREGRYACIDQFMVLFERMHSLMGFQEVLEGLYLEPEAMGLLADRLVEYDVAKINRAGELFGDRIHGFGGTDDWGTQQAAFISPQKWREFFLPRYKRIWDAAHSWGWDVALHSCGKVNELIGPLTEAGAQMLNLQQPKALGIREVGKAFRGKVCFETLNDIQHTLPTHDLDAIEKEAEELLSEWAAPEGGFVFSDYGDGLAIGVPDEIKRFMLRTFLEKDPFAAKSGVKHPAWALLE